MLKRLNFIRNFVRQMFRKRQPIDRRSRHYETLSSTLNRTLNYDTEFEYINISIPTQHTIKDPFIQTNRFQRRLRVKENGDKLMKNQCLPRHVGG